MSLSSKDKSRASHGFGFDFHHTKPRRRMRCVLGDMLAPLSADDIPPISSAAMASVQAAIGLLADLVEDRDHNLWLGISDDHRFRELQKEAQRIRTVARALAGILRVEDKSA